MTKRPETQAKRGWTHIASRHAPAENAHGICPAVFPPVESLCELDHVSKFLPRDVRTGAVAVLRLFCIRKGLGKQMKMSATAAGNIVSRLYWAYAVSVLSAVDARRCCRQDFGRHATSVSRFVGRNTAVPCLVRNSKNLLRRKVNGGLRLHGIRRMRAVRRRVSDAPVS